MKLIETSKNIEIRENERRRECFIITLWGIETCTMKVIFIATGKLNSNINMDEILS